MQLLDILIHMKYKYLKHTKKGVVLNIKKIGLVRGS